MTSKGKFTQHNVPAYLITPDHPVSVVLIGCGGTGSHVLPRLAQIDHALKALGHKGLIVTVYDPDTVSEANIGRQGYFSCDIGLNKATVLVSRVNRAYGISWKAVPKKFHDKTRNANIYITCVDTGKARLEIAKMIGKRQNSMKAEYETRYYWLDCGNSKNTGQVVLGTLKPIDQPKKGLAEQLATIVDMFPNLDKYDGDNEPSCSVMEALQHQDLCINSMVAEWAKKVLWSLFKRMRLDNQGVFINLDEMSVNPILIK